jgi:RNA polymerase sigma factor (TIGR02999 family)
MNVEGAQENLVVASGAITPAIPEELMRQVYDELRGIARQYLSRERRDHTLQPTALVHEAYVRLVNQTVIRWQDRVHFFRAAAKLMRRILVDYARKHTALKRGGTDETLVWDESVSELPGDSVNVIALDDALEHLALLDARQCQIVELRFFGGLSNEEIAEVLEISSRTVKREWRLAKAWLRRRISDAAIA